MKNTKVELKDTELEAVTGGVSEEELNGRLIINPTSEVSIPPFDIGYDVNYEKGTDWDPQAPTDAGNYNVSITPKGEYNH